MPWPIHSARLQSLCRISAADLFAAACRQGLILASDQRSCTNVNECLRDNGGCQGTCIDKDPRTDSALPSARLLTLMLASCRAEVWPVRRGQVHLRLRQGLCSRPPGRHSLHQAGADSWSAVLPASDALSSCLGLWSCAGTHRLPRCAQNELLASLGLGDVFSHVPGSKSIGWPAILAAVGGAALVTLGLGYAIYHFRARHQMQQQIREIMCAALQPRSTCCEHLLQAPAERGTLQSCLLRDACSAAPPVLLAACDWPHGHRRQYMPLEDGSSEVGPPPDAKVPLATAPSIPAHRPGTSEGPQAASSSGGIV